jgi:hypothetical protein
VETFTGQAARWWETHSPRLQTWTTVSTYFFERFRDKKLSKVADIPTFKIGYDPVEHIQRCESEWRKIGYKDERVWPHMFPSTLDEIPSKWYKIEEACGHTSNWVEIKENCVQDFEFNPEEEQLKDAAQRLKSFLENPSSVVQKEKAKMSVDGGSTSTCNFVLVENKEILTARRIDMENIKWPGQSFQWRKDHPAL